MQTKINIAPYSFGLPEMFDRVVQAYDLPAQFNRRIVWVGLGSSNRGPEDLARTGITQFVLIDNGFVEHCNLGTQSYYTADIGKPKVEVVASRLRAINSTLNRLESQYQERDQQFADTLATLATDVSESAATATNSCPHRSCASGVKKHWWRRCPGAKPAATFPASFR